MTIVFLSARYPPDYLGGGELSTAAIAEGLAARGHQVTVLAGAGDEGTETVSGVTVKRSRALQKLWAKPLGEERLSRSLLGPLLRILPTDAEILHAHDFRSALLLSLVRHGTRVVTVRDYAPICGTTNNMWWDGRSCDGCFWVNVLFRCHRVVEAALPRKPFRVWQYKANLAFRGEAYRAIPHHVYISRALRDRIATRLAVPDSAVVIPNPISPAWLTKPLTRATPPRVVFAGTVDSTKGVATLLEAWAELRDVPGGQLEIIGAGALDTYRNMAAALGIASSVSFLGKQTPDVVRERFDAARVIVQPSRWEEPFGRTVIEAYARGKAVVVSDVGGLKDLVSVETGIRVPPGNASALADALRGLLENASAAQALGNAGRARVEQAFTADAIAAEYEALYLSARGERVSSTDPLEYGGRVF